MSPRVSTIQFRAGISDLALGRWYTEPGGLERSILYRWYENDTGVEGEAANRWIVRQVWGIQPQGA